MANTHAEIGLNRTGIATSPQLSEEMVAGTMEFPPMDGDERDIALARQEYARDAEPIGSTPPPTGVKGLVKTAVQALKGEAPAQFVDKLGERLGFERTGVRLYEALLSKFDAFGPFPQGPTRAEIAEILEQEFEHFQMLNDAVVRMGGDPTVMTPSADLHATLTKGVLDVVVEPRTTLVQCLEAALLAELEDNDCWASLSELAEQAGEDDIAAGCERALQEERQHLASVRKWLAAAQGRLASQAQPT